MYRDFLKVKGVNLTVKELKKQNKNKVLIWCLKDNLNARKFYERINGKVLGFKDCDEDEKVLIAAQGWAEEKNGFTILFEETT
mgnify:CR=1 FL=1